jgi:hypothetical protein
VGGPCHPAAGIRAGLGQVVTPSVTPTRAPPPAPRPARAAGPPSAQALASGDAGLYQPRRRGIGGDGANPSLARVLVYLIFFINHEFSHFSFLCKLCLYMKYYFSHITRPASFLYD